MGSILELHDKSFMKGKIGYMPKIPIVCRLLALIRMCYLSTPYNEFALSEYYSDNEAPTDWQNPNPIKFLTVENITFNFCLALNKKDTDRNQKIIDSDPALLHYAETAKKSFK